MGEVKGTLIWQLRNVHWQHYSVLFVAHERHERSLENQLLVCLFSRRRGEALGGGSVRRVSLCALQIFGSKGFK